jgi:hypothetical protein
MYPINCCIKYDVIVCITKKNKQTAWPLVRKRTIPTERPPLVDEVCITMLLKYKFHSFYVACFVLANVIYKLATCKFNQT